MARSQHTVANTEPPPGPTDAAGWQASVKDGSYERCRLEKVVIAIQDLRAELDKPTLHALSEHLSKCIFRILRSRVSKTYPNSGNDIIDDVHDIIWIAILDPQSKDGAALREAFTPRMLHRLRDALRRQQHETQNQAKLQSMTRASSDGTTSNRQEVALTLSDALDQIPDDRKRLAFRLHHEGVPFKSTKGASIEKALGVSDRTLRDWVKEAEEIFNQYKGDAS